MAEKKARKIYTPEERATHLTGLAAAESVAAYARASGITEATLYAWKNRQGKEEKMAAKKKKTAASRAAARSANASPLSSANTNGHALVAGMAPRASTTERTQHIDLIAENAELRATVRQLSKHLSTYV